MESPKAILKCRSCLHRRHSAGYGGSPPGTRGPCLVLRPHAAPEGRRRPPLLRIHTYTRPFVELNRAKCISYPWGHRAVCFPRSSLSSPRWVSQLTWLPFFRSKRLRWDQPFASQKTATALGYKPWRKNNALFQHDWRTIHRRN